LVVYHTALTMVIIGSVSLLVHWKCVMDVTSVFIGIVLSGWQCASMFAKVLYKYRVWKKGYTVCNCFCFF